MGTAFEIVGRANELDRLRTFVDPGAGEPAGFVLEGDAGVGKSTLWLAGVDHARARGFCVLPARPAEAEQGLANVGLGDLFDGVLGDVLPALTPPRRRALEAALLLEDTPAEAVDPRALATAVRSALHALAERAPLLIAIDDLQWFDGASTSALAFALRRLATEDVRLLLARRHPAQPSEIEQALPPERIERMTVGPLSVGALHRLLRDRFGRPFARQSLLRIHERSGGNPFFALELAQVLGADPDPVEPLPVPETLEELVRARISGLPAETRKALAFAAALGTASTPLIERAGVAVKALDAAFAARVIERDGGVIRFTHPLLASVLYSDLGEERWSVHERIARVADEPISRARHLAASKATPDAAVAAELDDAAGLAADRGAAAIAAELAEQARRLTPADAHDDRHRRAVAAAHAHRVAGEWTRAKTIATELLDEDEIGVQRAEVLVFLAELESSEGAVALLEEALREAASRPALAATIQLRLAWATRFRTGYVRAQEHVRAALAIAEELDDDVLRERAYVVQANIGWMVGDPQAPQRIAQSREFAAAIGGEQLVQEATMALANTLAPAATRDEARAQLEREHLEWHELDEPRSARALWGLAWLEFWAGRWPLAAEYADRALGIRTQYGLEVPQDHLPIALIAVHRGLYEKAREHSDRGLELAEEQMGLHPPQLLAILALVAVGNGDAPTAAGLFDRAQQQSVRLGWGEPSLRWWSADAVELYLELGRREDAAGMLDRWEADAVRVERRWTLAHVTRCRALVAAADGDVERSAALLEQAIAEHREVGDPFGEARALLALGVVRRRRRQKRPARDVIELALAGFGSIGAVGWAQAAHEELGRVGGRTRVDGLTPAERRVAALVAEGRTNREVAAALFLGERTIASHLTHIYAKLGVRSRTELARKVQTF